LTGDLDIAGEIKQAEFFLVDGSSSPEIAPPNRHPFSNCVKRARPLGFR